MTAHDDGMTYDVYLDITKTEYLEKDRKEFLSILDAALAKHDETMVSIMVESLYRLEHELMKRGVL